MSSTRITRHVDAPRANVYRALLDARAVARWMVPSGMTSHADTFDLREGDSFRLTLTYGEPTGTRKTAANTDTFYGRLVTLVTNEHAIIQVVEFQTTDPTPRGKTTAITLSDAHGDTDVLAVHGPLPLGVRPADNQNGWSHSLAKLAALLEAGYIASADASMPGRPLELALDSFAGQRCSIHGPEQLSLIPRAGFPFARPLLRRLSTPSRASGGTFGVRQHGSVRTTCSSRWPTCRVRCAYFRPSYASNLHLSLHFPHTIRLNVATRRRPGPRLRTPDLLASTSTTPHLIPFRHSERRHSSPIRKQPQTPGMSAGKFRRHRALRDGP